VDAAKIGAVAVVVDQFFVQLHLFVQHQGVLPLGLLQLNFVRRQRHPSSPPMLLG
jgi:hypothetical protein